MTVQSTPPTMKKSRRGVLLAVGVVLFSGLLAGCSRPSDENISKQLANTYACKNMELVEYVRTDSLPGIFTYVAQYSFQYRFKDGEEGAKKYFSGLFAVMDMKGENWDEWLKQDKVQDYIADECSESGQMALERMIDTVLPQMLEKKENVRLPVVMPMLGWSEMMPSKKGWDFSIRRDKTGEEPMWSKPIARTSLLAGKTDKSSKTNKQAPKK